MWLPMPAVFPGSQPHPQIFPTRQKRKDTREQTTNPLGLCCPPTRRPLVALLRPIIGSAPLLLVYRKRWHIMAYTCIVWRQLNVQTDRESDRIFSPCREPAILFDRPLLRENRSPPCVRDHCCTEVICRQNPDARRFQVFGMSLNQPAHATA